MKNKLVITDRSVSAKTPVPFVACFIPIGGKKPQPLVLLVTAIEAQENQPGKFNGTATVIKSPIHDTGKEIRIGGPDKLLRRVDFAIEKTEPSAVFNLPTD